MTADRTTLEFYDREASVYAGYAAETAALDWLDRFAGRLTSGAAVLDFGSGSGWAAHEFRNRGFRASALDGSSGLAAEAKRRYGITVRVARFEEFGEAEAYGGIWASFSLLHDLREAMLGHLARLHRALLPEGWLYLGLKAGEGESRDRLGRRYTYYGAGEIEGLLRAAGFADPEIATEVSESYDGSSSALLHILARRGV